MAFRFIVFINHVAVFGFTHQHLTFATLEPVLRSPWLRFLICSHSNPIRQTVILPAYSGLQG